MLVSLTSFKIRQRLARATVRTQGGPDLETSRVAFRPANLDKAKADREPPITWDKISVALNYWHFETKLISMWKNVDLVLRFEHSLHLLLLKSSMP